MAGENGVVPTLSPSQSRAAEALVAAAQQGELVAFSASRGVGRTTVLRTVCERLDGAWLDRGDLVDAALDGPPDGIEEAVYRRLRRAVETHRVVVVDDLHQISSTVCCGVTARHGWFDVTVAALADQAARVGSTVVASLHLNPTEALAQRARVVALGEFTSDDYRHFLRLWLGDHAAGIDVAKLHRFAPRLSARDLRSACTRLLAAGTFETDAVIEDLRQHQLASNVALGEVQKVELSELKGIDDVIEALEANVVVPLEQSELAERLDLRPKRGVLLVGPPGTGKTTIGRALAHRLKGKFFLIDGTVITGTEDFLRQVHGIFRAAMQNAPSVLFIDDSDIVFRDRREFGLYRYLLTMLDGLESESAGRVCLMLTAMDLSALPPALVRSGRVELWLETRLPDVEARTAILRQHVASLPAELGEVDVPTLAAAAEGLTGADLKRVIEDGKLLLAHDEVRQRGRRPVTDYFVQAVNTVRSNRDRYAAALQQSPAAAPESAMERLMAARMARTMEEFS